MTQIIRPAVIPDKGAATAKAVLDIVEAAPERHIQTTWEHPPDLRTECRIVSPGQADPFNTKRCAGTWAWWIHNGYVPLDRSVIYNEAPPLLGLRPHEANMLYHHTTNADAVQMLKTIAVGEEIEHWLAGLTHCASCSGLTMPAHPGLVLPPYSFTVNAASLV